MIVTSDDIHMAWVSIFHRGCIHVDILMCQQHTEELNATLFLVLSIILYEVSPFESSLLLFLSLNNMGLDKAQGQSDSN